MLDSGAVISSRDSFNWVLKSIAGSSGSGATGFRTVEARSWLRASLAQVLKRSAYSLKIEKLKNLAYFNFMLKANQVHWLICWENWYKRCILLNKGGGISKTDFWYVGSDNYLHLSSDNLLFIRLLCMFECTQVKFFINWIDIMVRF